MVYGEHGRGAGWAGIVTRGPGGNDRIRVRQADEGLGGGFAEVEGGGPGWGITWGGGGYGFCLVGAGHMTQEVRDREAERMLVLIERSASLHSNEGFGSKVLAPPFQTEAYRCDPR